MRAHPLRSTARAALGALAAVGCVWPATVVGAGAVTSVQPTSALAAPTAATDVSVLAQTVVDGTTASASGAVTAYAVVADPALGTDDSTTYVYTPPGYDPSGATRYPVLYLFHGTPGASSDWFDGVDLADELDTLITSGRIPPVIAVSPEISTSYVNDTECLDSTTSGPLIDSYLTQAVVPWVDATFPTQADRAHRTLVGFSMGAFCATNLLFQHQDLFSAAGAMADYADPGPDAAWLLASDEDFDAQSPSVYLADPDFPVADDLTLFLTVGELSQDVDVQNTADIAQLAADRGVTVAYEPDNLNDHTWDMVDANLTDALVFLLGR